MSGTYEEEKAIIQNAITKKRIKKDNPEQNFLNNNHDLTPLDYYEKQITGDGNCYYRCLSYYYRDRENYYLEFRQLLYFEGNKPPRWVYFFFKMRGSIF